MSSVSSPVREALEGLVAGQVKPDRVVSVVTAAYYGEGGRGTGKRLRPLVEVIERHAPGVVELAGREGGSGFAIRSAERPFPPEAEAALRAAAAEVLATWGGAVEERDRTAPVGLVGRFVAAVRRVFSASA